jgi:hypothetical protein
MDVSRAIYWPSGCWDFVGCRDCDGVSPFQGLKSERDRAPGADAPGYDVSPLSGLAVKKCQCRISKKSGATASRRSWSLLCPFRAMRPVVEPIPRALPWARLFGPFGAIERWGCARQRRRELVGPGSAHFAANNSFHGVICRGSLDHFSFVCRGRARGRLARRAGSMDVSRAIYWSSGCWDSIECRDCDGVSPFQGLKSEGDRAPGADAPGYDVPPLRG